MGIIDLNLCFPESKNGERTPLPKQEQFMKAALDPGGASYILYSGGVGSGKTLIGCITILTLAVQYPGDYLICRLFNPELKLTTYKAFLDICPKELIIEHRIADQVIRLKSSGGKVANIIFRGLEEPDKHRSLNLNAAYIDEASQVSEEAFVLLQSRLRGAHVRKILCTTNPNGHSWLWRYWIKNDWPNEKAKKRFFSVHAPSTENVHLPEGYVEGMLETWSEERVKREVYGNWDSFSGQVYEELDRAQHIVKPFRIPEDWTKFVSADHGYRNAACFGWWAVDYDGNLYLYKSFYQSGWIIEEICKGNKNTREPGIVSINGSDQIEGIWIDPSTRANRGKDSDWQTYLDHLPKTWSLIPANNEVTAGIDRVKQYLKKDPKTGKPRLFIFDTNKEVIDEMFQYRWEELTPGQEMSKNIKEAPVKRDDHGPDMLRYGVMSRPESPRVEDKLKRAKEQNTMQGSILRELAAAKGGDGYKDIWGEQYIKDSDWNDNT